MGPVVTHLPVWRSTVSCHKSYLHLAWPGGGGRTILGRDPTPHFLPPYCRPKWWSRVVCTSLISNILIRCLCWGTLHFHLHKPPAILYYLLPALPLLHYNHFNHNYLPPRMPREAQDAGLLSLASVMNASCSWPVIDSDMVMIRRCKDIASAQVATCYILAML